MSPPPRQTRSDDAAAGRDTPRRCMLKCTRCSQPAYPVGITHNVAMAFITVHDKQNNDASNGEITHAPFSPPLNAICIYAQILADFVAPRVELEMPRTVKQFFASAGLAATRNTPQ